MKSRIYILIAIIIAVPVVLIALYFFFTSPCVGLYPIDGVKDVLSIIASFLMFMGSFSLAWMVHTHNRAEKRLNYEPRLNLVLAGTDSRPLQDYVEIRLIESARNAAGENRTDGQETLYVSLCPETNNKTNVSAFRIEALRWRINVESGLAKAKEPKVFDLKPYKRKFVPRDDWQENIELLFLLPAWTEDSGTSGSFAYAFNGAKQSTGDGDNICTLSLKMTYMGKDLSRERYQREFKFKLISEAENDPFRKRD